MIRAVVFDVGECLVDETREYGTWADWLGVPRHTFVAQFGAVIAEGRDYRETFQVFRPGFDLYEEREKRAAAGQPEAFGEDDLYPDVRPALVRLRADGLWLAIAGEPPLPTRELVAGAAGVRARAALEAGDPVEAVRIHLRDIVRVPASMVDALLADRGARAACSAFAAAQIADDEAIDALGVGIERFAGLETPTTLIEGDQSPAHLRERLSDLAATLPNARVVTLAGQGHVAHVVAPAVLASAIRETAGQVLRA
ncbi:hypothetical protein [Streptomyces sp. CBMA123]|uniref:hypothetical protein n=1 Tax=Streptomyces sp. CBMA123 TaxID=1896313 RepID=UPI001CB82402|nr:hypothetical protein [Streptomyces sp. CBMA123]